MGSTVISTAETNQCSQHQASEKQAKEAEKGVRDIYDRPYDTECEGKPTKEDRRTLRHRDVLDGWTDASPMGEALLWALQARCCTYEGVFKWIDKYSGLRYSW